MSSNRRVFTKKRKEKIRFSFFSKSLPSQYQQRKKAVCPFHSVSVPSSILQDQHIDRFIHSFVVEKKTPITFNDKQINCRDNDKGTEFIDPIIFHYRYDCCELKHDIYRTDCNLITYVYVIFTSKYENFMFSI
ncbi:hypothetical protein DERP_001935 [Dermatophagoides pteronyssinus]|uniref:Uncharacterized protein n=1 Tax=Dermatophagoides pteronyssinus TaxID=6956 RepID=A0ABQ8JCG3_DERPT|nr:hypothetical protein DERP_001935 [Dermatophagoides pteronyssinus]